MGCGASSEHVGGIESPVMAKYQKQVEEEHLPGKLKYLGDIGAAVSPSDSKQSKLMLAFVDQQDNCTTFALFDPTSAQLFTAKYSDPELAVLKESCGVLFPFPAVFKSISSDILKGKASITSGVAEARAEFSITSLKDMTMKYTLVVTLKLMKLSAFSTNRYVLAPLIRSIQKRRQLAEEHETKVAAIDHEKRRVENSLEIHQAARATLLPIIVPLREAAASNSKLSAELVAKIAFAERKLRRLKCAKGKHRLDAIYEDGGASSFPHLPNAEEHIPSVVNLETDPLADWLRDEVQSRGGGTLESLTCMPSDPMVARMAEVAPKQVVQDAVKSLRKIDDWDFNVFDLEAVTNHNALFYVTYTLLHKLDLVRHFHIDDLMLRRFLAAMQAGYHPNPYHNATHAADVCQINYFILTKGGLAEKCRLSKEQLLAAVLAGAIHDYDHPGFNNNFHSRTNAYLATLYNDRSILENHHLACIFEMLRHPNYRFLAHLAEAQLREIRETMIEMVLATDMGLHGKIFTTFRTRLQATPAWHESKEDVRLALSMSLKMADVSNCGRPKHIYLEWAKNIATEFYSQGDAEEALCLPVSPFMNRRKDKVDFPKGQISFMQFIVVPMFEAIAEILPPVECALQFSAENKEYWQQQEE